MSDKKTSNNGKGDRNRVINKDKYDSINLYYQDESRC